MIQSVFSSRFQNLWDILCRIVTALLTLFYDARIVLSAVLFLICADQVMGVAYAIVRDQFSWKEFKKVYRKVLTYMTVILAAFVYERFLLSVEHLYFTQVIGALVGFQELSSAYIKFAKLTGIEVIETLIKKLKG